MYFSIYINNGYSINSNLIDKIYLNTYMVHQLSEQSSYRYLRTVYCVLYDR